MDNVVQNIKIDNIIPGNFIPSNEERQKIEELAQLIKTFGLIDPILVRPKNGKYEIILGMDKYQAALIANQSMIPAIIKEVDDETFLRYSNIDNKQEISSNSLPTETFSKKEENSDIVNLSELSKINLEYERDDIKMNNGQFNNEMMNNNFGQPTMEQPNQGPTFGGKFFPSLEDEPTNMNMMGGLNTQPLTQTMPSINNNLIDLTDLSTERENSAMNMPNLEVPTMEIPNFEAPAVNIPTMEPTQNFNQPQQNNFAMPNIGLEPMQTNDTIINLDSLQNNNPAVMPMSEPAPLEILNQDFGAPIAPPTETPMYNHFDMRMSNNFNQVQPDFNINQQSMPNPEPQFINQQQTPIFNIDDIPTMKSELGNINPMPTIENNISTSKDVTPVTNTIKNLVASLEAFGYKININEENLLNTTKITIEIEK